MANPEPSAGPRQPGVKTGSLAVLASRRERLAIVSTRDTLCGIAAYTAALDRQLADLFDVTVLELNQYLLRHPHSRVRPQADKHIEEICRELAQFDAVNLQLEHGTLGRSAADICRRFAKLVEAAPRLSVTFHTVKRSTVFPVGDFLKAILARRFRTAMDIRVAYNRNRQLSFGIAKHLRRAQRHKPVSVVVHNPRDRDEMKYVQRIDQVFDHPLAFLTPAEIEAAKNSANRKRFAQLTSLPGRSVLIGVFGFINDYKGFRTLLKHFIIFRETTGY